MELKFNKIFIYVTIILIILMVVMIFKPIQEKCFGEDKVECNYLEELNVEHTFYLIVLGCLWIIILGGKKKQEILDNLLDVLIAK